MQPLQFKRQSQAAVDVNLTPLIDVVFLLLIFFMVSTSFTREAQLTLTLPEAERATESSGSAQIDVLVDANGFYRVGGRMLVDTKPDTLAAALQMAAQNQSDLPVAVTADKSAPYQNVVRVIDIAGQIGFSKINLTTQPRGDQPAVDGAQL